MTRLRPLGYGALVTVVVFYYLAVPTLREVFGPVAVLPAYAAVALLAGVVTYHVVRFRSRRGTEADGTDATASTTRREPAGSPGADADGEPGVDEMLGDLEAEREG